MPAGALTMAGIDTAKNVVNAGMGLILQRQQDKRQINMSRKLQRMQMEGDKEMTDYNIAKQLQMWKDTSYPAQIEQIKKAGLNPGLLYGMGGAGGQTANIDTGRTSTAGAPTGGGEVQAMMGMGIQRELLQAQKDLIQAQAENVRADTANKPLTGANIQASTSSLLQGIENQKTQKALMEVETAIKSIEEHVKGATQNLEISKIMSGTEILRNDATISTETRNAKIKQIQAEATGAVLKNALTEAQTGESKQRTAMMETQIAQIVNEIQQKWVGLQLEERKTLVQEKLMQITLGKAKQEVVIRAFESIRKLFELPNLSPVSSIVK